MAVLNCWCSYLPRSNGSRQRYNSIRSCLLPFPVEKANYHRQLSVAIEAVQRACCLCVDVKRSLLSNDRRILEKTDQTPVTVADFGVQALISLELEREFPTIPLVAEEDSAFLRSKSYSKMGCDGNNVLVDAIFDAVSNKIDGQDKNFNTDDVLRAIDRGGKDASSFNEQPATYWVLDPIDGTKGFLKGSDALYVVGLALVVEGEIVLGVMGCPNWQNNPLNINYNNAQTGVIMVAHLGCGTWTKSISFDGGNSVNSLDNIWKRCFVDSCTALQKARFCIPESQTWDLIPLSNEFGYTTDNLDPTNDGKRSRTAWDHAVGVICVHEAGGQVSDWDGNQLNLVADIEGRRIIFPSGGRNIVKEGHLIIM
ncbi:putative PAP-specific phosphatase [Carex littledalei]|uniref:Putative PAP-specific phosphatase n=1 Tax=Carex littledalei TaxID=544730 RepID=A0A833QCW5_9POAL|nr:putative PAP-specific phosphatase [Carex littledalei]